MFQHEEWVSPAGCAAFTEGAIMAIQTGMPVSESGHQLSYSVNNGAGREQRGGFTVTDLRSTGDSNRNWPEIEEQADPLVSWLSTGVM